MATEYIKVAKVALDCTAIWEGGGGEKEETDEEIKWLCKDYSADREFCFAFSSVLAKLLP